MTPRLSKFRSLSWPERRLLVLAALLLPVVWAALRAFGLRRTHAHLNATPRPVPSPSLAPARIGYLVNAAAGIPFIPATCLTRSLLLNWLLRRRGIMSEVRIGVRMRGNDFHAHAWVECDGRAMNDAADVGARFTTFDDPPPPRSFPSP